MSIAFSISAQPVLRFGLRSLLLLGLVGAAMATALTLGRYPLSLPDIGRFILASAGLLDLQKNQYDLFYNLIIDIRLPRVVAACLVGASLSTSGAAYQAVFRNPLVSPDILGVLGGAAFGAALGLWLGGSWILVEFLAFTMGLAAAAVGVFIANLFGSASLIMLVLGGMISSALFAALLTIVKYLADPYNQLPAIIYWLMGSLGNADLAQLKWVGVPMLFGIGALTVLGRALDALSMGDDEARALGVPVNLVRYGVIIAATLVSALTVSIAGMIGWIGLLVPHLARLIVGPLNSRLMPASAAFGAIFLLAADALARSLGRVEIPIGILTELLGITSIQLVLARARRSWV
jgi:iron complex transport system permease protein